MYRVSFSIEIEIIDAENSEQAIEQAREYLNALSYTELEEYIDFDEAPAIEEEIVI